MNESYYDILFLTIILAGLFARIFPIVRFDIRSVDNYYHLLAARQIWKEKRIPRKLEHFLFSGTYSYPPLLHLILAPIGARLGTGREKVGLVLAPIADIVSAVILYFFVESVLGEPIALIATLMYVITPILVIESLSITPRTLGALFLNLFIMIAFLYSYNHNYWLVVPAILSVAIILLTHKMAAQSLFFVSVASSAMFLVVDLSISAFVSLSVILGFFITLFFSRGFYRKVLRGHKAMLRYHFKHGNYKGEKKFGNPLQILQRWPWLMLFPLIIAISYSQPPIIEVPLVPLVWGSAFLALTMLWRYGDNYRYLVYGIAPLAIVFAVFTSSLLDSWRWTIIGISIALCTLRLSYFFSRKSMVDSIVTEDLLDCLSYIKNQESYQSFGCVPVSINYPSAFYADKAVLGAEAAPEPWERGLDFSHFYRDEDLLLELMSNYGTRLYLVNSSDPAGATFESLLRGSKKIRHSILHACGRYKVYELDNKSIRDRLPSMSKSR